jgi:hypothetical protein
VFIVKIETAATARDKVLKFIKILHRKMGLDN